MRGVSFESFGSEFKPICLFSPWRVHFPRKITCFVSSASQPFSNSNRNETERMCSVHPRLYHRTRYHKSKDIFEIVSNFQLHLISVIIYNSSFYLADMACERRIGANLHNQIFSRTNAPFPLGSIFAGKVFNLPNSTNTHTPHITAQHDRLALSVRSNNSIRRKTGTRGWEPASLTICRFHV